MFLREKEMRKILPALSLLLPLIGGCRQAQEQMHPWQTHGNPFAITIQVNEWDVVPSEHLGRVSPEYISACSKKLEKSEFYQIPPEYAATICRKANFIDTCTLTPYLVRGISYNNCPTYSIVKRNKDNWISVFQATYNGEIYIPGMRFIPKESPIVIYLDKAPEKIFPIATVGGDGIFRGVDLTTTWTE